MHANMLVTTSTWVTSRMIGATTSPASETITPSGFAAEAGSACSAPRPEITSHEETV